MVFSSLLFLFKFIPVFFLVYYIVPYKYKNVVLFAGSIIFYGWGEPKYLILIFVSILVNYFAGLMIDKTGGGAKKAWFFCAAAFDLSMLIFFKYTSFFIENINSIFSLDIKNVELALPLGISFYTFQILSYIIDLYKGRISVEKSPLMLGTYLCMFPQLIAGPIVVYSDVSEALHERKLDMDNIEDGIRYFILGLGSKVLIANNIGMLWDDISLIGYENISMPLAWLGVISFTLQIYFDFNGYSMMAIGLGKMLGFSFPKNFNFPYISRSLTEFFRRWHISLSAWFREYVYIPLGGSRRGIGRTFLNLFIVWFLTGFWHGAGWNFILWGMFFFIMLSIEKTGLHKFIERHVIFSHIYAILFIGLSWMIFAITDIKELAIYFTRLFCGVFDKTAVYYFRNYIVIIIIGCVLSTPLLKPLYEKIKGKALGIAMLFIILFLSVAYLADASYNPFLYFRF